MQGNETDITHSRSTRVNVSLNAREIPRISFRSTGIKLCNQEVIKRVKKASRSYKKSKKKRGNNEENQCTKKYINKRKTKESK